MYPHFTDEETDLAPSHMAGKWQSWTITQTPNPVLFLLYRVRAWQARYEVHDQNRQLQELFFMPGVR